MGYLRNWGGTKKSFVNFNVPEVFKPLFRLNPSIKRKSMLFVDVLHGLWIKLIMTAHVIGVLEIKLLTTVIFPMTTWRICTAQSDNLPKANPHKNVYCTWFADSHTIFRMIFWLKSTIRHNQIHLWYICVWPPWQPMNLISQPKYKRFKEWDVECHQTLWKYNDFHKQISLDFSNHSLKQYSDSTTSSSTIVTLAIPAAHD